MSSSMQKNILIAVSIIHHHSLLDKQNTGKFYNDKLWWQLKIGVILLQSVWRTKKHIF